MNIAGMSHWYDREQNIMEKTTKKQQKNNIKGTGFQSMLQIKQSIVCIFIHIIYNA